jgi:hypothetical protein
MAEDSPLSTLLCGIAVILFIVGLFAIAIWAIVSQGRKARAKRNYLLGVGFTAVKAPDPALVERFVRLYQKTPQQEIELRRVLQADFRGGLILVFDVWDTGGEETSHVDTAVVGIISPDLDLPRFSLMPHLPFKGPVGGALVQAGERLSGWVASKAGLLPLSFADHPEFEAKFRVFGQNEAQVRQFLSPDRLAWLAGLPALYKVEAGGDAFALDCYPDRRNRPPEQEIAALLEDAHRLFDLFLRGSYEGL